jgi:hypothetical protein
MAKRLAKPPPHDPDRFADEDLSYMTVKDKDGNPITPNKTVYSPQEEADFKEGKQAALNGLPLNKKKSVAWGRGWASMQ